MPFYDQNPTITCGKCTKAAGFEVKHYSVEGVRHCHLDEYAGPCGDFVQRYSEDGAYVGSCDALRWGTERGSECELGHDYVDMDTRHRENWDYAHDEVEAANLRKHGVGAVSMRGDSI